MTNALVQYIIAEESTDIQWVNKVERKKTLTILSIHKNIAHVLASVIGEIRMLIFLTATYLWNRK